MKGKLRLLFDDEQFRGHSPGEQTYALSLIEALSEREDVEIRLLASRYSYKPYSERCADLAGNLPKRMYTRFSDFRLFAGSELRRQRAIDRFIGLQLSIFDFAMEPWRLSRKPLDDVDLFHVSRFRNLKLPRVKRPAVVATVHDLIPLLHPEYFARDIPKEHERNISRLIESADRIVAVSERTRNDLIRLFPIDADHVDVVPCAVRRHYLPGADTSKVSAELANTDVRFSRYLLMVGTIEPRKNVAGLIEALSRYNLRTGEDDPLGLVVVGREGWMCSREVALIEELAEKGLALWLKDLDDFGLHSWYCAALALAMPSFHEGFGLPVAEALSCGCPVLTSAESTMSDIAGKAALVFDPGDADSIGNAISEISGNEDLRGKLIEEGLDRAETYKRKAIAESMLDCYRRAIEQQKTVRKR